MRGIQQPHNYTFVNEQFCQLDLQLVKFLLSVIIATKRLIL